MSYHLPSFKSGSLDLGVLREAPDGARTLCLAPIRGEGRLGEPIPLRPHMSVIDDAIAPLVARFASLVFTENNALIEPFLEELRWVAIDHGIDHVVLPLWPETKLADDIQLTALAMGLPADFILTQDNETWPHQTLARNVVWEQTA